MRETAALLRDVLRQLRDEGLLTAGVLTALPLDAARFGADSEFRPLFDAVDEALVTEPLIPVAGGGYGVTVDLALGDAGVKELPARDKILAERKERLRAAGIEAAVLDRDDKTAIRYRVLTEPEIRSALGD